MDVFSVIAQVLAIFPLLCAHGTIRLTFCNPTLMEPISIFVILVLVFSIIIHEVAHGYAANALGDPTARLEGRLTLNPISHIDPLGSVLIPGILVLSGAPILFGWAKPVPYNPYNLKNQRWGEAPVAGAGPGVNLAIAVFFGLLIRVMSETGSLTGPFLELSAYVVYMNILLALFNLIPLPPLDGSKILKALLPARLAFSYAKIEETMMRFGLLVTFLLLFIVMQFLWPYLSYGVGTVFGLLTGFSW